jgi:hypothetical protein
MAAAAAPSQAEIEKATKQLAGLRETSPNVLFFIARSKNENIVVYEAAKKSDSELDPAKPIDVYWLDIDPAYQQANRKKGVMSDRSDLNMIEKQFAYGVGFEAAPNKPGTFLLKLVALPERPVTLFIKD